MESIKEKCQNATHKLRPCLKTASKTTAAFTVCMTQFSNTRLILNKIKVENGGQNRLSSMCAVS